jgi:hypothetical protein
MIDPLKNDIPVGEDQIEERKFTAEEDFYSYACFLHDPDRKLFFL